MNLPEKITKHFNLILMCAILICVCGATAKAQNYVSNSKLESARSDKLTGGRIEKSALAAGNSDIKITINVPAFQLTLWQSGKEIETFPVGVGMKDYPIFTGRLEASAVIWNPVWIPPSSDWVEGSKTVKAGEIILPTDSRNPLGKVKIPLGYGYLIHQAKSSADLGSLVSHGCVRVMQNDLYDLAAEITTARSLPVTDGEILKAKNTKETLNLDLESAIPVEITYDTLVVEAGKLHIYPDVYDRKTNTIENLRAELESSGVNAAKISDLILSKMLAKAGGKKQFVVSVKNIEAGKSLTGGQVLSVVLPNVSTPAAPSRETKRKVANGTMRQRRVS
ncbi:MAG: L,D-transpeptidase [Pyrinomonadaceae bacterium]